jgi:signal transduction histidine kinase
MNMLFWSVEYIASFIELLLGFVFCGIFIDKSKMKTEKKRTVLFSLVGACIILAINSIALFSLLTLPLVVMLFIILLYAIYPRHLFKTPVFTVTYLLFLVLLDLVVLYLFAYILEANISNIVLEHSMYRAAATVLSKGLLTIFIYGIYRIVNNPLVLSRKFLVLITLLAISFFAFSSYIVLRDVNVEADNLTTTHVMFTILMMALVLTLFFGIIKFAEHQEKAKQLSLLEMRNSVLKTVMDETERTFFLWKTSLHDYRHNIIHLMNLAEKRDFEGIAKYLEEENALLSEKSFFHQTGNDIVDAVLYVKQAMAKEHSIPFLVHVTMPEKCRVSDSHLCAVLGNLIDNAINASKDESSPYIDIGMKQVKDFLVLKVVNRFTKNEIMQTLDHENMPLRGIGLQSVRKTINDYDGEFDLLQVDDTVVAQAMFYNPQDDA